MWFPATWPLPPILCFYLASGLPSGHVWLRELDLRESWAPKNWCFWTVVLEKTLESPLDCKEIQPVHPKGNQSWVFIGRTDAEAEAPTLAPWCEEQTHWKRPWCWERLKAGERDDRGWDGWLAWWTWVWTSSGRWWRTEKPGVLQSMELQSVNNNLATCLLEQRCCPSSPVPSSLVFNFNLLALPSVDISLYLSVGINHSPQ